MTPLNGYVIFRRQKPKEQTASGLLLPLSKRSDDTQFGTVVAAGHDASVSVGDLCLIGRGGEIVRYEGEELVVLKDEDILAVLEGESA